MNKAVTPSSNPAEEEGLSEREIRRLVGLAQGGDQDAFGLLVRHFHQRLYGVVYKFVRSQDLAHDLVQQTWIKAWTKLHTFKGKSAFFTWLYRIASYVSLDYLRKRKRRREEELLEGLEPHRESGAEVAFSANPRPDRVVANEEIRVRFEEALSQLSPEHRLALVLREVEGLSYEEIARAMKCRKGTVMSRLYYARKNVQAYMKDLA